MGRPHSRHQSWRGGRSVRCVREALAPIVRQLQTLNDEIAPSDRAIMGAAKTNRTAPGVL